jgi:hypothetical protein
MVRKHAGWPSRARQDDTSSTPNPNNGAAHAAIGRSFQLPIAPENECLESAQRMQRSAKGEKRSANRARHEEMHQVRAVFISEWLNFRRVLPA